MSDFYYRRIAEAEQKYYRKILAELNHLSRSVRIRFLSSKALVQLVEYIKFDHPELFYVDFHQIRMTSYSDGNLAWEVSYLYSASEIKVRKQALETTVKMILQSAGDVVHANAVRKAQWIHDKLVRNIEYDKQASENEGAFPEAYTVEGVFRKKKAVCQGIALAVILLGDYLGMNIGFVKGRGFSDEIGLNDNHSWNLVNLGYGYAHMDVTWDVCLSRNIRFTRYDYFLIPDKDVLADHAISVAVDSADVRNASYFAQTKRDFQTMEECGAFIKKMLLAGKRTLYFRYWRQGESQEMSEQKFVDLITKTMQRISLEPLRLEMCQNEARGIYFYRLK